MDCKHIFNYRSLLLHDPSSFFCCLSRTLVITQLYLFLLVAFGSETLYIPVHHRVASALSLLFSAIIYGAIFWWLYYKIYINIDRKQDLRRLLFDIMQMAWRTKSIEEKYPWNEGNVKAEPAPKRKKI